MSTINEYIKANEIRTVSNNTFGKVFVPCWNVPSHLYCFRAKEFVVFHGLALGTQ
jgi:hypothetical protein